MNLEYFLLLLVRLVVPLYLADRGGGGDDGVGGGRVQESD